MTKASIECLLNPFKQKTIQNYEFATLEVGKLVSYFHQSLPNYKPTPVVRLSQLAKRLGLAEIFIKDESQRFDLNAFKVLGASYAIAKFLAEFLSLKDENLNLNTILAQKAKYQHITFVTATDGNHGRAVAWSARLFGCPSVVYMPNGSSPTRLQAIQSYGADASITSLNYDDTVMHANQQAQKNGWVLLQDTAWEDYQQVPENIMQGYFSLVTEFVQQQPNVWPTHILVQAGVGSLAAAIFAYLVNVNDKPTPKFIVVEPEAAPCLYESAKTSDGKAFRVMGDLQTIMAGLACGEPSLTAWEILKKTSNAYLKCSDDIARRGMRVLGNPLAGDQPIVSGESGAATLGALYEILTQPKLVETKNTLELDKNSKVLLFSTEGDTDPELYRNIVWG